MIVTDDVTNVKAPTLSFIGSKIVSKEAMVLKEKTKTPFTPDGYQSDLHFDQEVLRNHQASSQKEVRTGTH